MTKEEFINSLSKDSCNTCESMDRLIFTNNKEKVIEYSKTFSNLQDSQIFNHGGYFTLENGIRYEWVKFYQSRGHACRYAVVDLEIINESIDIILTVLNALRWSSQEDVIFI